MTIEVDGNAVIPGAPGRKGLVLYKHPGGFATCYGWGAPVTESLDIGNSGIPLPEAQMVTFMAEIDRCFAQPLHLLSALGPSMLTYQEIF